MTINLIVHYKMHIKNISLSTDDDIFTLLTENIPCISTICILIQIKWYL